MPILDIEWFRLMILYIMSAISSSRHFFLMHFLVGFPAVHAARSGLASPLRPHILRRPEYWYSILMASFIREVLPGLFFKCAVVVDTWATCCRHYMLSILRLGTEKPLHDIHFFLLHDGFSWWDCGDAHFLRGHADRAYWVSSYLFMPLSQASMPQPSYTAADYLIIFTTIDYYRYSLNDGPGFH